jgi:hypothetical protein
MHIKRFDSGIFVGLQPILYSIFGVRLQTHAGRKEQKEGLQWPPLSQVVATVESFAAALSLEHGSTSRQCRPHKLPLSRLRLPLLAEESVHMCIHM